MLGVDDIARKVSQVAPAYNVARVSLFGSYARGEQRPESDVDLVVDLGRPLGFARYYLIDELERSIGAPVDVVFGAEQLYKPIRSRFDREKLVLYERS